jgi:hypothetical protein
MHEPAKTTMRNAADLAAHLSCTRAAVYSAIKKGHIEAISAGASKKLPSAAFEYHRQHGFGPKVPTYSRWLASQAEATAA